MPAASLSTATADEGPRSQGLVLPRPVLDGLLARARSVHEAGLKAFGLLLASPDDPGYPFCASDVVVLDPARNRRNDPAHRSAFEAQGGYFRAHHDAGFVADPQELFEVYRRLEDSGLEPVAMFHSHRRQPANFSYIDFRLHNPAYPWHLIISLRDPLRPSLAAFEVRKDPEAFGIDPADDHEGSERSYPGPEVRPLRIVLLPAAA
jgi:proteasome lid subunit RPN8/RPN11